MKWNFIGSKVNNSVGHEKQVKKRQNQNWGHNEVSFYMYKNVL